MVIPGQPRHFLSAQSWVILSIFVVHVSLLLSLELSANFDQLGLAGGLVTGLITLLIFLYSTSSLILSVHLEPGLFPPKDLITVYNRGASSMDVILKRKVTTVLEFLSKMQDSWEISRRSSVDMSMAEEKASSERENGVGDPKHQPSSPSETRGMYTQDSSLLNRQWRFCTACLVYRPPGTSHCGVCQRCVQEHDHHCMVIGACIGSRNRKYFICMTFGMALYCLLAIFMCAVNMANFCVPEGWGLSSFEWTVVGVVSIGMFALGTVAQRILPPFCVPVFMTVGSILFVVLYIHLVCHSCARSRGPQKYALLEEHVWSSLLLVVVALISLAFYIPACCGQLVLLCFYDGQTVKQNFRATKERRDMEERRPENTGTAACGKCRAFVNRMKIENLWRVMDVLFVPSWPPPSLIIDEPEVWKMKEDMAPIPNVDLDVERTGEAVNQLPPYLR